MTMSLRQIGGYLHHAPALAAQEQLDAYEVQRLFHLRPHDRRRGLAELQRVAAGQPMPTAAATAAARQAEYDAGWARLRRHLGGPRGGLQAGEKVLIPVDA